jgi:hypothetical protein
LGQAKAGIKRICHNQQKREWQALRIQTEEKAISEVMCGGNKSKSEQKWKQQVMGQLLPSPTKRTKKVFLIASQKSETPKTRYEDWIFLL